MWGSAVTPNYNHYNAIVQMWQEHGVILWQVNFEGQKDLNILSLPWQLHIFQQT